MVLTWALRASRQVDDDWKMRAKFVLAALKNRDVATQFLEAAPTSPLGRLMAERPQTVGNLIWPYQCAAWDASRRLARISGHLDAIQQIPGLNFAANDKLLIADLSAYSENLRLILDQPPWLSKEGHLTLSLFKDRFRAFSVSFSLFRDVDGLELFIGGIQGRQNEHILDLYRTLTKQLDGVRPRDFMLETLRMFGQALGVDRIYGVADDHKISKHPFFRKAGIGTAYDPVWEERGGTRVAETHYQLPLSPNRRQLEEVPAKKRSMYRRRYEMFDMIMTALPRDLAKAEHLQFEAE